MKYRAFSVIQGAASLALLGLAAFLFVPGALSGCSSNTACDSSKCAAGNKCIAEAGDTRCRRLCSSQTDLTTGCPFGYTCSLPAGAKDTYCSQDTTKLKKKPTGQWGAPCNAAGGLDQNPDCDSAQSFWCYGVSPTDGDAYCTQFDCKTDKDCAGGFWCATVNSTPNVLTTNRVVGDTQKVCVRRGYCAPCVADIDCPLLNGGPQWCVGDNTGQKFCSPQCATTKNCNNEATCVNDEGLGATVCKPIAGTCKGDGSLCSPCRSDADCPTGACVKTEFSTEHFCTVKSNKPCTKIVDAQGNVTGIDMDCPKSNIANAKVTCAGGIFYSEVPPDQCHGLFELGTGTEQAPDPGCFTPAR